MRYDMHFEVNGRRVFLQFCELREDGLIFSMVEEDSHLRPVGATRYVRWPFEPEAPESRSGERGEGE